VSKQYNGKTEETKDGWEVLSPVESFENDKRILQS
jgi:hypothetical protein